jgi:hypothetical protein
MNDLKTVLELATDELDSPDLARSALAKARRRRSRRRGAVASVAAGVAVVGAVVVPRAFDSSDPVREPSGTPTPTTTPEPAPTPDEDESAMAPPIDESVIQRAWDPSTAADLPYYPLGLPTVLAPVGGSSSGTGTLDGVLALSRSENDRLAVLYGERGWYGLDPVPEVGDIRDSSLSRDGTRMAVVGEGGLFWCPAGEECPEWSKVEVPDQGLDEDSEITWTDDPSRLIVAGYYTGYLVDLDNGRTTELPYLGDYATFDLHHDGTIVSRSIEPRAVLEWDGTEQTRSTLSGDLGGLNDFAVHEGEFAATRIDITRSIPKQPADGDGLIVLDRDGLATRSFLPFTGASGQWVDGAQVKPVQWINKLTVLVSVESESKEPMVHLVTWNVMSGDMAYATSYPASYDVSLRDLYPA